MLGLALFCAEVCWRQGLGMPWSQFFLLTVPTPLIAIGLLYGALSIVLSSREGRGHPVVGIVVGLASIALFAAFAYLRLWPLS